MSITVLTMGGNIEPAPHDYEQIINYTMLYDEGDENVAWEVNVPTGSSYQGVIEKREDSIYMYSSASFKRCGMTTFDKMNFADYEKLYCVLNSTLANKIHAYVTDNKTPANAEPFGATSTNIGDWGGAEYTGDLVFNCECDLIQDKYLNISQFATAAITTYIYNVFIVKADDINTLCEKAGASAPTSLDTLLADTTSLTAIFNNEDAVNFMVKQCTGDFMVGVLNSASAVALLKASPYLNAIIGNPHWAKFIMMIPTAKELLGYTMISEGGTVNQELTGGLTVRGLRTYTAPTLTIESDCVKLYSSAKVNIGWLYSKNQVDLTPYSKYSACYYASQVNNANTINSYINVDNNASLAEPTFVVRNVNTVGGVKSMISVDLEGVSSTDDFTWYQGLGSSASGSLTTLLYFMVLTKADDWETWASLGGVSATDLASLLADSTKMATLMANEEACKYLMGCTGDLMISICNSETAMSALVNNIAYDYAFNHPVWYKFMTMIPTSLSAMDSVAVTVPTMTSNTEPSGTVSASNEQSGSEAYHAFDNDTTTGWITNAGVTLPANLNYEFPNELDFYKFEIENTLKSDSYAQVTNGNILLDDVIISTFSNIPVAGSFIFMPDKPLRGRKVTISLTTKNGSWSSGQCKIFEAQFYGKAVAE